MLKEHQFLLFNVMFSLAEVHHRNVDGTFICWKDIWSDGVVLLHNSQLVWGPSLSLRMQCCLLIPIVYVIPIDSKYKFSHAVQGSTHSYIIPILRCPNVNHKYHGHSACKHTVKWLGVVKSIQVRARLSSFNVYNITSRDSWRVLTTFRFSSSTYSRYQKDIRIN